ncbi:unnamed protein product, partial [Prorocentrum cordatum]
DGAEGESLVAAAEVAELARAVADASLPSSQRSLAAHVLHERCLDAAPAEVFAPFAASTEGAAHLRLLVDALLDLMVGEDVLMPAIPVKLLWSVAALPGAGPLLEDAGAVPAALGVLRAAKDPLLAGAALAFVERASAERQACAKLCGNASTVRLLLLLLWRWGGDLEACESLLLIFERALRAPCHALVLGAEVSVPGQEEPLRLVPALQQLALAAEEAPGEVGAWAAGLAREWAGCAAFASASARGSRAPFGGDRLRGDRRSWLSSQLGCD